MSAKGSIFVEVLAVLFIVGVVAAVAIPDTGQVAGAKQTALESTLKKVRTVLDQYSLDQGRYPTLFQLNSLERPAPARILPDVLSMYLTGIPLNPFTQKNRIGFNDAPVGSSDWYYDPENGSFHANDSTAHRGL